MSSVAHLDDVNFNLTLKEALYEICIPYNNENISCSLLEKLLITKMIYLYEPYTYIVKLINSGHINFLSYNYTGSFDIKLNLEDELNIVYKLYEYIIVNGIDIFNPIDKINEIHMHNYNLYNFYAQTKNAKKNIRYHGGITKFVLKFSKGLIKIKFMTNSPNSVILYIEN